MQNPYILLLLIFCRVISAFQTVDNIKSWLVGTYGNEKQVKFDIERNLMPKDGGHELVNAIISQHTDFRNILVASFFLEGNVNKPYRYRYYNFFPNTDDSCIMKLYKPSKIAIKKLLATGYSTTKSLPPISDFEYLQGCDVCWSRQKLFGIFKRQCFKT